MRRIALLAGIIIFAFGFVNNGLSKIYGNERTFIIQEKIFVKNLPPDMDRLRIWIPYPVSDEWQRVDDFRTKKSFII